MGGKDTHAHSRRGCVHSSDAIAKPQCVPRLSFPPSLPSTALPPCPHPSPVYLLLLELVLVAQRHGRVRLARLRLNGGLDHVHEGREVLLVVHVEHHLSQVGTVTGRGSDGAATGQGRGQDAGTGAAGVVGGERVGRGAGQGGVNGCVDVSPSPKQCTPCTPPHTPQRTTPQRTTPPHPTTSQHERTWLMVTPASTKVGRSAAAAAILRCSSR